MPLSETIKQQLMKERNQWKLPSGWRCAPWSADLEQWHAKMKGPAYTLYEGLAISFNIYIPTNYPDVPPKVVFKDPIPPCEFELKNGELFFTNWSKDKGIFDALLEIDKFLKRPISSAVYRVLSREFMLIYKRPPINQQNKIKKLIRKMIDSK